MAVDGTGAMALRDGTMAPMVLVYMPVMARGCALITIVAFGQVAAIYVLQAVWV